MWIFNGEIFMGGKDLKSFILLEIWGVFVVFMFICYFMYFEWIFSLII